jgi:hypothetical protein
MLTYDGNRVVDASGTQAGKQLPVGMVTRDGKTVDSTGAFLVGELERLDQTLHMPLAAVTFARDIDLREDVTIADEASSFTLSSFGSAGGLGIGNGIGNGKAWIGKTTDQITGVSVDIAKIPNPLDLWGMELKYTIPEIESAARLGRPVDQQKFEGMQLKHQMDIDEQVYIGDTSKKTKGMVNHTLVTPTALPNGVGGSATWATKTPDEILADVNLMLVTTWKNSALAVMPDRLLLPPNQFGYIATQKVSSAGNLSILKYILENNILVTSGQGKLNIFPLKWLQGAGVGGTLGTPGNDRAVVYLKEYQRVRYPMTMLQRTPIQYDSIYHKTTYYCRLGGVELVYPETMGYYDGL